MNFDVAYLAQGKLYLKLGQAPVHTVKSEFGQSVRERSLQSQRRNAWKNKSIMDNFLPPQLVQQLNEQNQPVQEVTFTSLCPGNQGKIFYALEVGEVAGIFTFDPAKEQEQRLFHSSDFRVQYLDFHPEHNQIACTLRYKSGVANIAVMQADGIKPLEVTEGDSVDLAPHWLPGSAKALVFQSAGVGRDGNGYACEQGPFTIEKLIFSSQEVASLTANAKYDFLGPQITADGTLYYIRRPYRPLQKQFNFINIIRDIILMPFRLLYAIFQWLNFFTQYYTGKPLTPAGMPRSLNVKPFIAWDQVINLETTQQRNRFGDADAPALVPRSWQLMREQPGHEPEAIAEGVVAFDVGEDGSVVYSNGSAIYGIAPHGVAERLLVDKLIEQVVLLNPEDDK